MSNSTSIQANETLFDVAIREYGHLQGIKNLIQDNDLGFTDEPEAGTDMEIDSSASFITLSKVSIATASELSDTPNEETVKAGQNMFDLAIQVYGDLSGILNLANDNDKSLTDDLEAGETLQCREETISDTVVDFFSNREQKPATALTDTETEELTPEGIGYWQIEYDFIVS